MVDETKFDSVRSNDKLDITYSMPLNAAENKLTLKTLKNAHCIAKLKSSIVIKWQYDLDYVVMNLNKNFISEINIISVGKRHRKRFDLCEEKR